MPSLADSLTRSFSSAVRAKGEAYLHDGRVSAEVSEPDRAEYAVRGTMATPYVVLLGPDGSGRLNAACDCPHAEGGQLCKHVWAALLQADEEGALVLARRPTRIVQRRFDDLDEFLFGHEDQSEPAFAEDGPDRPRLPSPPAARSEPARSGSPAPPVKPAPSWREALDRCTGNEPRLPLHGRTAPRVEYVIDVGRSLAAGALVIDLYVERTSARGERMIVPLYLNSVGLDGDLEPGDRTLVQWLRSAHRPTGYLELARQGRPGGTPFFGSVGSAIVQAFQQPLLRQMCETGRCRWILTAGASLPSAPVLHWDDGPPYTLRLSGGRDGKKKQWAIHAELVRPGETPVPLSEVVHSFSESLLFSDRIARAAIREHQSWIETFRKQAKLVVPFADREAFIASLWSSPTLPELALPPELTLRRDAQAPTPRLVLAQIPPATYPQRHPAHVEFQYGAARVRASDLRRRVVDVSAGIVSDRDREAEANQLAQLWERGFETIPRDSANGPDVAFLRRELPSLVPELTDLGWTVEADGRAIRRPGNFQVAVSSGVDWFDLEGSFDFGGVTATLPELLRAVREGRKYVLLDDGSQGMLPAEWLQRFGGLAGLGEEQEGAGAVRFRPSQAMLLDALLAAQDGATFDRAFLDYCQRLRSFTGVRKKPAPAGFHGELREYQREGLGWLGFLREFRIGGCLADDMGLGKTIQVLAHLAGLRGEDTGSGGKPKKRMPPRKPSLAVVPKSLVFNWRDEAARFTPDLRVVTYTGEERHEEFDALKRADLVITTYGTLRKDILKLKEIPFDTVILDEAQAIKNANSHSAKACRLLQADHRLAMTGTPIENHLGELWSLFEFLNPGMLGRSSAFQQVARSTETDSPAVKILARAISPYVLRRTKAQVLRELPEKTEQTLYVDLPPRHRKLYNELRDHVRATLATTVEAKGLAQSKIHVLEALLRLRQAACHPGLVDPARAKEGSAKLEALLEQLEEVIAEGHKVLVFSQFTSLLALVRTALKARNIPYEYLDGATSNRKAKVERFQQEAACPVFLISLKAGGHGLNLTAADYVFILDPWWNPAVEAQAIDRAHRMGQSKRVFAYRIIARDTVEEKVLELQQQKRDLAEAIISENQSLIRKLTAEDLQRLLS